MARGLALLGLASAALLGLARDGTPDGPVGEVAIGVIGPLTGPASAYGISQRRGAELAARDLEVRGGPRLRLVVADDGADQTRAGALARDLAMDERVAAIVGAINSDCTHQVEMVAVKLHLPQVTTASTDPSITDTGSPWIFRCLADDVLQARALAARLVEEGRAGRVALLSQENRYGRMGIAEAERAVRAAGGEVVVRETFPTGTTDFDEVARRTAAARPDAVVVWSLYREGAGLVRALRAAGATASVFAGDGLAAPEFLRLAGEAAEGAVVTCPFDPDGSERARELVREYRAAFGEAPDSFAAHGYDAVLCLADAARRAGTWERAALRAALARTSDLPGATGLLGFDATGNDPRPVRLARVEDGRFALLPRPGGDR